MVIPEKVEQMIKSGDPEMAALGISLIIDLIENVQDYYIVKQFIMDKVPVGSTPRWSGQGFKKQTSARKRLRIAAQKKYYVEILLKTGK